ncbi:protein translocase subunit secY/sec61 alpha [Desulfurobacterium pacificum]|jgi:preprotein translocase subunit SecY|uniref:Protein translocase subunit SecY n=1 Tax=Desulfurobacterium pacificum TaxID=240166 RepID=A0ABY1NGR4_9BACT|nr:preprotein translocase subunit SecY [Desulfurobacterium pacificum]SMP09375.1 protein translocase subunit secY/sec61 alpha [Desulfurobacterium pacificum]
MNLSKIILNVKEVPELKKRFIFTMLLLAVYRLGAHIPTPGINVQALSEFFQQAQGTVLGFMDVFSGGALSRLTIFALGVMPYISAAIIMQVLTVAFPSLEKLAKEEGEYGRKKINQYTRYGAVLLAFIQSLGIAIGLKGMTSPSGLPVVPDYGFTFIFVCVSCLTAGATFLMWLGEKITAKGIGNGMSILIFAGIVSRIPNAVIALFTELKNGDISLFKVIGITVIILAMIAAIVYIQEAERRVPLHYARRTAGSQALGSYSSYLPIKLNPAGVIPIIFAASVLMFPATIARFVHNPIAQAIYDFLQPGSTAYLVIYAILIFFFTYFYTAIIFNPEDIAENLNKAGGFIPGVRAGTDTAKYLDRIVSRLTFAGAVFLTLVAVIPIIITRQMQLPFYFGGTAILIVVGVALDTLRRMEAYALSFSYEGFLGRRRRGKLRAGLGGIR